MTFFGEFPFVAAALSALLEVGLLRGSLSTFLSAVASTWGIYVTQPELAYETNVLFLLLSFC